MAKWRLPFNYSFNFLLQIYLFYLHQPVKTNCPPQIGGHSLEVRLKTAGWRAALEEELALCGDTTVPLSDEVAGSEAVEELVAKVAGEAGGGW